jgi:PiT family inorganic phosphate transporter
VDEVAVCERTLGTGAVLMQESRVLRSMHFLSAGSVCFARAVNDTPKIAALLFVAGVAGTEWRLGLIAAAMAVGGVLATRRVAETISRRITPLNPAEGLTANAVTAALVIGASHIGVPVSTTHVSVGSLFGIGVATRQARWKTVGQILLAWITTLPLAAALGALVFWSATRFFT